MAKLTKNQLAEQITAQCAHKFRSFGGGKVTNNNPTGAVFRQEPPCFALGVNIREVVDFVMAGVDAQRRRKQRAFHRRKTP